MNEEKYFGRIICPNCKFSDEIPIPKGESISYFIDYTNIKCQNCECYLNDERNH